MKNIKILLGILIIGFILIFGCAPKEEVVVEEEAPALEGLIKEKSIISMECVEGIVSYEEQSFWNQELETSFKEELIGEFEESIWGFGVEAKNYIVELDKQSSTLSCDVHGSFQRTWYDFDWFLRPRGLDFLDSPFEREERELVWAGQLAGTSTMISIKFPWLISNCHEHVWRR